jgi:hypothetical protein
VTLGIGRVILMVAVVLPVVACHETVLLDPTKDGSGSGGVSGIGSGGGGGSGGGLVDAGLDQGQLNCQALNLTNLNQHSPEVIFSVDRSGAMAQPFGIANATRLSTAQSQIAQIAKSGYNKLVRLGYQEFPSPVDCPQPGDTCCAGAVTKPSMNSFNSLTLNNTMVMSSCDKATDNCASQKRPILDALTQSLQSYNLSSAGGRKRFVLLVTAGEPNCSNSTGQQCSNTFNEVGNLADSGVTTYVLKVGDDPVGNCLESLALNGGGIPPPAGGPPYYSAQGPNDLATQMGLILEIIAQNGCRFDLPLNFNGDPTKLQATISTTSIKADMTDGWSIDSSSGTNQLVLHGMACDQLIETSSLTDLHVMSCTAPRH